MTLNIQAAMYLSCYVSSEKYGRRIRTSPSHPIHGVRTQPWWRTYQSPLPKPM